MLGIYDLNLKLLGFRGLIKNVNINIKNESPNSNVKYFKPLYKYILY